LFDAGWTRLGWPVDVGGLGGAEEDAVGTASFAM
jgi:hypothetical protein